MFAFRIWLITPHPVKLPGVGGETGNARSVGMELPKWLMQRSGLISGYGKTA